MITRLDMVRARVGPLVLGVGMAMLAVAFVGYSADHHPQAAAPPSPPATSSAPPAVAKPTKSRPSSAPISEPRHVTETRRVVAAAVPKTNTDGGTSRRRPSTIAPSGPKPSPPAASPPATTSCVAVLVLDACLRLGGTP